MMPACADILSLVRARTGRDFSGYKASSLTRRIERRMAVDQIETVDSYVRFLQEHPVEVETLVKDLLINVTSFFRDAEAFAALKKAIARDAQGQARRKPGPGVDHRAVRPGRKRTRSPCS